MRLIRSRAAEFRIDPARLGVLGFSAGGHLAADLAVSLRERTYAAVDAADALRPARRSSAWSIRYHPRPAKARQACATNLLGPNPAARWSPRARRASHVEPERRRASPRPRSTTAPSPSTQPDWIDACGAPGAPVEAHLFAKGGHGFGLHLPTDNPGSRWPDLFALWMRQAGG